MGRLDALFAKKPSSKPVLQHDMGSEEVKPKDEQAAERKAQRLERRELLYAVVRESMARIGMLSTSYKYKVLSLDSRGHQYLIMMDLPLDMAGQLEQLLEIEETVKQNARSRHNLDVTSVYWRISESGKPNSSLLRKPRSEADANKSARHEARLMPASQLPTLNKSQRFDPIRPDEVQAFKSGKGVSTPVHKGRVQDFAPTEFHSSSFEETRLDAEGERLPLSRTQYGDLI